MKDKTSPLDSSFMDKPKRITKKQFFTFIFFACIFGYGLAYSIADKTINYIIYNNRMEPVDEIKFTFEALERIEKIYYLKNNSPVPALTKVTHTNRNINMVSTIEKEILFENQVTYIYLNMSNTLNKTISTRINIIGEYEN